MNVPRIDDGSGQRTGRGRSTPSVTQKLFLLYESLLGESHSIADESTSLSIFSDADRPAKIRETARGDTCFGTRLLEESALLARSTAGQTSETSET